MSSTPPVYPYRRRRSLAGPLTMILVGVIFLLANTGLLHYHQVGMWFSRFWPLLIIFWGLVKLVEWFMDRSEGVPTRGVGAGSVVFLILLIMFGLAATQAARVNWNAVGDEMDINDDFFGGFFGQTYTFTNQQEQALTAAVTTAQVASDRGDITISAWDEAKVKVVGHKRISAGSQNDATQMDQRTQPTVRIEGSTLLINANTSGGGTQVVVVGSATHTVTDLEVFLPRNLAVEVNTRRGDISVRNRVGDVKATTQHGDLSVGEITGAATLLLRSGSLRAEKVSGDVSVEGRGNDTDISDVGGAARLNGEFFGQLKLARVGNGVTFNSSHTDLKFGKLEGGDDHGFRRPARRAALRAVQHHHALQRHPRGRHQRRCAGGEHERRDRHPRHPDAAGHHRHHQSQRGRAAHPARQCRLRD